jgi:membrane-bound lytic murein transglycosylase D
VTPAVGEARFFALAEAGVIAAETRNYVPQLIAAALVGKETARHGIVVRREAPLAYDEVRVPALTPLAAVAAAAGASRAELLDLNPHLLRGMTPPGGAYHVRVPSGRGDGAAARLADLDADDRRAFRRVVTRKRESFDALAGRAGVSVSLLRTYNPGLETVSRGKFRGTLVSNQAVRVPTAAVLAYARSVPAYGAPGGLASLPAPPPEPKTAERPAPKGERKSAKRADASAATDDTKAERPAGEKTKAHKTDKADDATDAKSTKAVKADKSEKAESAEKAGAKTSGATKKGAASARSADRSAAKEPADGSSKASTKHAAKPGAKADGGAKKGAAGKSARRGA